MKKKLGVLGGMGPQASIEFYRLIIEISKLQFGATKNEDFPHIYLVNIPVKDLIRDKSDQDTTIQMVRDAAKDLKQVGCDILAMSCNTMHLFEQDIFGTPSPAFISMIETVIEKVKKSNIQKVALLGSVTTMSSNLYKAPITSYGIELILPDESLFKKIGSIIHKIIAQEYDAGDEKILQDILYSFSKQGAQGVILGCTELPLVIGKKNSPIPIFSSLHILAETVCEHIYT